VYSFDSLRISIKSVESPNYYENYHISNSSSKIKDIYNKSKSCFLICSNIKIESAILNAKLRVKYLDQNFEIISSGLKHNTNIPSIFINCRLENILNFFEGKDSLLSKLITNNETSPTFIFGESFSKRFFLNTKQLFQLIKFKFPTSVIININSKSNTSSLRFQGLKFLDTKTISKTKTFFCFNLEDNFYVRSFILNKKANFF